MGVSTAEVSWQCPAEKGSAAAPLVETGRLTISTGQQGLLPRVYYHRDLHIEEGFVRTTIDQVYYNASRWRREGTYEIPIPRGAAISRLAMTVNGVLRESAMVPKEKGRHVFETIRREKRDPVLLEWIDGETFSMRVFPIEPKEHKRILISFTQPLIERQGNWQLRVPAFEDELTNRYSARVRVKDGANLDWTSDRKFASARVDGDDLVLETTERQSVHLSLKHPSLPEARFEWFQGTTGHRYAMVRLRPHLKKRTVPETRHWIVLFEASADRDPYAAREQLEALAAINANVSPNDSISVVVANTQVRVLTGAQALNELPSIQLIGGLDLSKAFDRVRELATEHTVLVHLGSGKPSLGERHTGRLLQRLPAGLTYLGIALGHAPQTAFFERAAAHFEGISAWPQSGADTERYLSQLGWHDGFEEHQMGLYDSFVENTLRSVPMSALRLFVPETTDPPPPQRFHWH